MRSERFGCLSAPPTAGHPMPHRAHADRCGPGWIRASKGECRPAPRNRVVRESRGGAVGLPAEGHSPKAPVSGHTPNASRPRRPRGWLRQRMDSGRFAAAARSEGGGARPFKGNGVAADEKVAGNGKRLEVRRMEHASRGTFWSRAQAGTPGSGKGHGVNRYNCRKAALRQACGLQAALRAGSSGDAAAQAERPTPRTVPSVANADSGTRDR